MPKIIEQHSFESPEIKNIKVPDFSVPGLSGNTAHPVYYKYSKGKPRYADTIQNYALSKLYPEEDYRYSEDSDVPYDFNNLDKPENIEKVYPEILVAHKNYIDSIMSEPEKQALELYYRSSNAFNKYLRANRGHLYTNNRQIKLTSPLIQRSIQNLHNVFAKTPMFSNYDRFNVYRGLRVRDKQLWDWVKRISQMKEKGQGFILPEMLSTSLSPLSAAYFSGSPFESSKPHKHPTLLEIVANHGIFYPEYGEHEFLLPNRSKFRLLETLPNSLHFPSGRKGNIIRLLQV